MTIASPPPHVHLARAATIVTWLASFGLLALVVGLIVVQVLNPPPAKRLLLVQDIPLPSGYIPLTGHASVSAAGQQDDLAPGTTQQFDHFDFQALDPQTHLLFIAHTGAQMIKLDAAGIKVNPDQDGHIIVFNTQQKRVVRRINVPHVTGIAIASDLHKVYASNGIDNIVYAIDEKTFKAAPIQLADNELPDAISYDQPDHRVFISDPGLDPATQDVTIIDARTDKVITKVNIGQLPVVPQESEIVQQADIKLTQPGDGPLFGYDIGHNRYDPVSRRVYVTTQILATPPAHPSGPPPPAGAGELMVIDPIKAIVVQRLVLPTTCGLPHGLTLDTQTHIAFVACSDLDPARNLIANLVRVDLKTMTVIPAEATSMHLEAGADIVLLDVSAHVLFVGCKSVVVAFSAQAGSIHLLGEYPLGKGTHTIAVDEATQELYLPLVEVGGRPTLRIIRYNVLGS